MMICMMETAREEEEEEAAGWHQKTRTPHRDVGKKKNGKIVLPANTLRRSFLAYKSLAGRREGSDDCIFIGRNNAVV